MQTHAWNEMIVQGWDILSQILEQSQASFLACRERECRGQAIHEHEVPLIFQNQQVKSRLEFEEAYGNSPFAAYLDGCSIVFNHADLLSPYLAFLCQDLQQQRIGSPGFPHAYANCYLTPPQSQTAPPHADDRDVLIFQLVGHKKWQVYAQVPVPYPYPHEQVGKDDLLVPPSVLKGTKAFDAILHPGDVLYLPRGMVHQAQSTGDSLSFHITVAIATHDWTVARTMSRQIDAKLMQLVDFRKSVLPFDRWNREATISMIQEGINAAFEMLQKEVTSQSIVQDIEARIDKHNRQVFSDRMGLIHQARVAGGIDYGLVKRNNTTTDCDNQSMEKRVGTIAAKTVTYTTTIRAATQPERAYVQGLRSGSTAAGLNVREEIADTVMEIVSRIKVSVGTNETFQVAKLRSLVEYPKLQVCDLTLLCLAKRAVELGAFAVVE
jgi:Cupin superfamily protein